MCPTVDEDVAIDDAAQKEAAQQPAGSVPPRALTLGESRVRIGFNPNSNGLVDQIKAMSAAMIDFCEKQKQMTQSTSLAGGPAVVASSERNRCLALAQTAFEDAAMWAVKGVTG